MKKHNTIKVVLITILVLLLLTWIIPAAYFSGEFVDQGRVQMGLFDLFNYPLTALSYFGYIGLFLILVGGFYGILYKIPAYRTFLDAIVSKAKRNEKVSLSIMIILIALLVSISGVQIGIALFIPLVVSVIILMGYDRMVAALVTVGGIAAGLVGSTYAFANISVLTTTFGLDTNYQIGVRFVILLVAIVLVIFNTLMYIKANGKVKLTDKIEKEAKKLEEKVEKVVAKTPATKKSTTTKKTTTKKSTAKKSTASKSRKSANKAALMDEDVIVVPSSVSGSHKIWPFVVTFALLFVVFVLAFITWGENGFGVKLFDDITKSVQEFKLFKFPIFAKVLGTFNSFGNWTITDMFLPMFLVILLLVLIYKVKLDDVFDGFVEGAKKALAPAFISILLYSILVLVTYHPFQLTIYKTVLGLSKGFNIVTTTLVAIISSVLNGDAAYGFQSVVPYFASVVTKSDSYPVAAIIFQSIYGLIMLVAPTSLILMATLSYLKVSYKDWLKNVWKLLLELFVILLIIFIILVLI